MSQSTIFSHVGMFSWVEPVLSNEDEVSTYSISIHLRGVKGLWALVS